MQFGQLNLEEKKEYVGKIISYGNQELMITGFEFKASKSGESHQISFNVESPTVKKEGFQADESAVNGGQVGRVKVGIYANYKDMEKAMEIGKITQLMAKKMAEKYNDSNLYERVCAINANGMEDYLKQFVALVKGKFVWMQICAEAYGTKTVEAKDGGEPKVYDKYTLHLGRYGYVATKEDGLKPFDKTNKYHYGYSKEYNVSPDEQGSMTPSNVSVDDAWA